MLGPHATRAPRDTQPCRHRRLPPPPLLFVTPNHVCLQCSYSLWPPAALPPLLPVVAVPFPRTIVSRDTVLYPPQNSLPCCCSISPARQPLAPPLLQTCSPRQADGVPSHRCSYLVPAQLVELPPLLLPTQPVGLPPLLLPIGHRVGSASALRYAHQVKDSGSGRENERRIRIGRETVCCVHVRLLPVGWPGGQLRAGRC